MREGVKGDDVRGARGVGCTCGDVVECGVRSTVLGGM